MFDPKDFPFNADKMAEFLKSNDFTAGFADAMSGNADDIVASQAKNMEALVAANKAAAASYQELFKKQLEVFEKTLATAKESFEGNESPTPEAAKVVMDTALKNMNDLATGAQKANAEAMEIVGTRVQGSLKELQEMAEKATKK